jgi:hypothetical protein
MRASEMASGKRELAGDATQRAGAGLPGSWRIPLAGQSCFNC